MNGGGSSSSSSGIDVWPLVSAFIEKQRNEDKSVDDVLHSLGLDLICADRNVETRWALAALAAAQCRARLAPRTVPDAGSLERVIDLLRTCSRVLVISGAGVSKGVPGFQQYWNSLDASGRGGLPDAMGLFDLSKFVYTPQPFLGYVRHLLSGGFAPSASHQFIRELERRSKLLRNYTQNVDTLEAAAGIERVVHVHGHLGEAACIACRTVVPGALLHLLLLLLPLLRGCCCGCCYGCTAAAAAAAATVRPSASFPTHRLFSYSPPPPLSLIRVTLCARAGKAIWDDLHASRIPRCHACTHHLNLLKPNLAFLQEPRGAARDDALELALREDVPRIDLLLVVGATLVVEPLKSLPLSLPHDVPQIYVGAAPPVGPLGQHAWDVELIGDCDVRHACIHDAPSRMHAARSALPTPHHASEGPRISLYLLASPRISPPQWGPYLRPTCPAPTISVATAPSQAILHHLSNALGWDLPVRLGSTTTDAAPPTHVAPNRLVFSGGAHANGDVTSSSSSAQHGASSSSSSAVVTSSSAANGDVAPQTPVAMTTAEAGRSVRGSGPKRAREERGAASSTSSWLAGATGFGSGVGARLHLNDTAPVAPPPPGASTATVAPRRKSPAVTTAAAGDNGGAGGGAPSNA